MQETLFDGAGSTNCERCGAQLKVDAVPGSEAKMLRRSKEPKGLCVNCAVHNWLRNTYPPNIQIAESGPEILLYTCLQEKFADLMLRDGHADARPDEIDWQRIVDNWELPFLKKVKPSTSNPCSQKEIDAIAAGTHPGLGGGPTICGPRPAIKSFEELNELEPGLGDSLKKCLSRRNLSIEKAPAEPGEKPIDIETAWGTPEEDLPEQEPKNHFAPEGEGVPE